MAFRNPLTTGATLADGSVTTTKLADGAVSSTKIATNLQSDNYDGGVIAVDPGTVGWRIERNTGDLVANSGTFRGTVTVTGGSVDWQYVDTTTNKIADGDVSGLDWGKIDTTTNQVASGDISDVSIGLLTTGNMTAEATIIGAGWLASDSYSPGLSGWYLSDVLAEFNSVVVRGTVYASAGELGTLDVTGDIILSGSGRIATADTGQRVELDAAETDALRFYTGNVNEANAAGILVASETLSMWGPKITGDYFANYIQITGGTTAPGIWNLVLNGKYQVSTWDDDIVLNTYSNNPGTPNTSDIRIESGGGVDVEFGHNDSAEDFRVVDWTGSGYVRFKVTGDDILFYDDTGVVKSYWDESLNLWRYATDIRIDSGNDLFTHKIHTGGTSWTQEPWSASTIELGNYGAIGTQGSYDLTMAWNWERGTDSGYHHKNVNSDASAGAVRITLTGIEFRYDDSYGATSYPTMRTWMDGNGRWHMGSSAAPSAYLEISAPGGTAAAKFEQATTSTTNLLLGLYSNVGGTGNQVWKAEADGDSYNRNGTWGTISDERWKDRKSIRTARDYSDDLRAFSPIKYRLAGGDFDLLGYSAQQVEKVKPGLVKTTTVEVPQLRKGEPVFRTRYKVNTKGKRVRTDVREPVFRKVEQKVVKTSVMIPMLHSGWQAHDIRIEALERRVDQLESALSDERRIAA